MLLADAATPCSTTTCALQRLMPSAVAHTCRPGVIGGQSTAIAVSGQAGVALRVPAAATRQIIAMVERIKVIAERHVCEAEQGGGAAFRACPLVRRRFGVIQRLRCRPERIADEDYAALNTIVPAEFWRKMRDQNLVSPDAPLDLIDRITETCERES